MSDFTIHPVFSRVTGVTRVTASIGAALRVTLMAGYGVTEVTASLKSGRAVTPVTPPKHAEVTRKPAWIKGVTHVTRVTPLKTGTDNKTGDARP